MGSGGDGRVVYDHFGEETQEKGHFCLLKLVPGAFLGIPDTLLEGQRREGGSEGWREGGRERESEGGSEGVSE